MGDCFSEAVPVMIEAFFQLLPLLMIPHHCQARPGAWVWGRVGDEAKAAAFSADVVDLTSDSSQVAVTLEDGRYAWGEVEVKTEVPAKSEEDFETLFPVSAASAAPLLLSASPDVIESTPASPPSAVTLEDGRWSWGAV